MQRPISSSPPSSLSSTFTASLPGTIHINSYSIAGSSQTTLCSRITVKPVKMHIPGSYTQRSSFSGCEVPDFAKWQQVIMGQQGESRLKSSPCLAHQATHSGVGLVHPQVGPRLDFSFICLPSLVSMGIYPQGQLG